MLRGHGLGHRGLRPVKDAIVLVACDGRVPKAVWDDFHEAMGECSNVHVCSCMFMSFHHILISTGGPEVHISEMLVAIYTIQSLGPAQEPDPKSIEILSYALANSKRQGF